MNSPIIKVTQLMAVLISMNVLIPMLVVLMKSVPTTLEDLNVPARQDSLVIFWKNTSNENNFFQVNPETAKISMNVLMAPTIAILTLSVPMSTAVLSVLVMLVSQEAVKRALTSMSDMNCSHVHSCVIIPWAHTNATAEMAS